MLKISIVLLATIFIASCGGGGSSSSSGEEVPGSDPLTKHQWYLHNVGQSALTSSSQGGTPNADINALLGSEFSLVSYAQGMSGDGVEIAIIDSGLEITHEDLVKNVIADGSYNFSTNNGKGINDPSPTSVNGDHGTSVAGLAAARGYNSKGMWGAAPRAKLRGFNYLQNQTGSAEIAVHGYQPTVTNFNGLTTSSLSVFNKSYGSNPISVSHIDNTSTGQFTVQIWDAMKWGTENLRGGKGAVYVKAAGNEYEAFNTATWCNEANSKSITCYNLNQEIENNTPYQIMVGGFNANDQRSSYSNTGSSLWISAPAGEFGTTSPALLTTDVSGCSAGYSTSSNFTTSFDRGFTGSENESCHYYSAFNGTSSATPVTSGVMALILEANPNLTWRDAKHILAVTARRIDSTLASNTLSLSGQNITIEQGWVQNAAQHYFSNAYGFGAIDVQAAITMALDWKAQNTTLDAFKTETATTQTFSSNNVVPSGDAVGLSKTQTINSSLTVETVVVKLSVTATSSGTFPNIDASDYLIELTSPSGTKSILLTPFNAYQSGHQMSGMVLASHAFYEEPVQGSWTLRLVDMDSSTGNRISHQGEGKLDSFTLTFYGH